MRDTGLSYSADGKYISLGNTALKPADVTLAAEFSSDAFRIVTRGKSIFAVGKTETGTQYGAYELLYRLCGLEWLHPDCYTIEKNVTDIPLMQYDITENPDFALRYGTIYRSGDRLTHFRQRTQWADEYIKGDWRTDSHNSLSWFTEFGHPENDIRSHSKWMANAKPTEIGSWQNGLPSETNKQKEQICFNANGDLEERDLMLECAFKKVKSALTDGLPAFPEVPPQATKAFGPRLTPHFITEPWSSENTYQYFDVVLVDGTSYIAHKQVIPTGVEITDTEYWAEWAQPNAQYNELLDTVNTFDGRITTNTNNIASNTSDITELSNTVNALNEQTTKNTSDIASNTSKIAENTDTLSNLANKGTMFRNKKILGFFDSWGTYEGTGGERTQIGYQLGDYLGATVAVSAVSGRGWVDPGPGGNARFIDSLNSLASSMDLTDYDYFMVMGSINDYAYDYNAIYNAIKAFSDRVKELNQSAELIIVPPISAPNKTLPENVGSQNGWYKTFYAVKFGAALVGAKIIDGGYFLMNNNTQLMREDNLHPTASGIDYISKTLSQAFFTGTLDKSFMPVVSNKLTVSFNATSDVTSIQPLAYVTHDKLLVLTVNIAANLTSTHSGSIGTITFPEEVFNNTLNKIIATAIQVNANSSNGIYTFVYGTLVNNSIDVQLHNTTTGASYANITIILGYYNL